MNYDIVSLMNSILEDNGLSSLVNSDLDVHSTISLEMKNDMPSIHIRQEDDKLWIWRVLSECNEGILIQAAHNIIPLILTDCEDYFNPGSPFLRLNGNELDLRAQINMADITSPDNLLERIEVFDEITNNYIDYIK